jgi:glyoxylase-like metal-dependent hydrolase (beta-lactamase superfamily II)
MSDPGLRPIEIVRFVQGPAQTNAYLVGERGAEQAVVIDPAWDGRAIQEEAGRRGWRITDIWLTHAHFDHFGGAAALADSSQGLIPIALHPADQPLWRALGGAPFFGLETFDPGPEPTIPLEHGMSLHLGGHNFVVLHTPGHSPGHVIFLEEQAGVTFCGDLIFQSGIGRFDLPGGDEDLLLKSIQDHVLSLSDSMRLLPGHGPETTVGEERRTNPFLTGTAWD